MSAKPWYPWYVGDARAKMRGLTLEQRGAYRELLDEYYIRAGSLPADRESLWRIADAHTDSERASVELVAGAFFVRDGARLINRRAEKEIDRSRQLAEFGRSGGQVTQANAKAKRQANHQANDEAEIAAAAQAPQPHTTATSTTTATNPLPARDGAKTMSTWNSYAIAYHERYGTDPVRNARVNSQIAAFVNAIGVDEAPDIAAFYVTHNKAHYVANKHPTSLLLKDAEGLRTDWATNHRTGDTEARQADRTQATGNAFARLLHEAIDPPQ